jgi:hypothetical protein
MERSEMSSPTCTSLSHDTERCLKAKTTNLHRTPPLIMHIVTACAPSPCRVKQIVERVDNLFSFVLTSFQSPVNCTCAVAATVGTSLAYTNLHTVSLRAVVAALLP